MLIHMECAANIVIGVLVGQATFWLMGVSFESAVGWNALFLAFSYGRQYALRRVFARLERRKPAPTTELHFKRLDLEDLARKSEVIEFLE
jgi:hypothetical protein